MLAHWDEVERERPRGRRHARAFRELGGAAGSSAVGVSLHRDRAGRAHGPVHVQLGSEEEIFFVLGGSGLAWIDGAVHEIGAADTLVYLAEGPAHTLVAGDDGLAVLSFGENADPPLVRLPRAGMVRRAGVWLEASRTTTRSSARRRPARSSCPSRRPRPQCSVALEDAELDVDEVGEVRRGGAQPVARRGLGALRPAPRGHPPRR